MGLLSTEDLAAVRTQAEAGDMNAQLLYGKALTSAFNPKDALPWLLKAGNQGSTEANALAGEILLVGSVGIPAERTVKAMPSEGLKLTYRAATNLHPRACYNMARAHRFGMGTETNVVEAYAWYDLAVSRNPNAIVYRLEMNELVMKMDTASIERSTDLGRRYKAGLWSAPKFQAIPNSDPRLKLGGVTFGAKPLAIISGKTVQAGETFRLRGDPPISLTCLEIRQDFVLVQVEGENGTRRLDLSGAR